MGSDLITIFSPIEASPRDVAVQLLRFVQDELLGQLRSRYYARIEFDPEQSTYLRCNETLAMGGEEELLRWIERDQSGFWSMGANLGFAPAEMYAAVFPDRRKPSETTLVLEVDSRITRWLETEESTRIPFAVFLARVAHAIGARWFAGGILVERWNPLSLETSFSTGEVGFPYALGWRKGAPEGAQLPTKFNIRPDEISTTTLGYQVVSLV